jgi:hypothetical protein
VGDGGGNHVNQRVKAQLGYCYQLPLRKTWHGDDPRPAFDNGRFIADNWNDQRLNLLRVLLRTALPENGSVQFDWDGENAHLLRCWCEDQTYYFIRVRVEEIPARLYHIEWYKDRGCTDVCNLDGRPMTERECYDLTKHLAVAFGDALGALLEDRAAN